jgi:RimJ/RimL family protein N-acetyltransferase
MAPRRNEFGQPIGPALPDWRPARRPELLTLAGQWCRLEKLDAAHADDLWAALAPDDGSLFTYLGFGPFHTRADFDATLRSLASRPEYAYYAVIDRRDGRAAGKAAYARIDPANGSIEVGGICYAPRLQRTAAATEAMVLMMRHAFEDLGYRRYEWKCDALNAPSRAAAARLGFQYEGLFRQAIVYKGRSRDTAWYSIIDTEWPVLKPAYAAWLAPANFDTNGRQKTALSDLIAKARA